jgi:hypothetical protein
MLDIQEFLHIVFLSRSGFCVANSLLSSAGVRISFICLCFIQSYYKRNRHFQCYIKTKLSAI